MMEWEQSIFFGLNKEFSLKFPEVCWLKQTVKRLEGIMAEMWV